MSPPVQKKRPRARITTALNFAIGFDLGNNGIHLFQHLPIQRISLFQDD